MGKPEGTIENYLAKRAKENGMLCYKTISPSRRGFPDRTLIGNGHVIFVELKSASGKLSESQKVRIKEMKEHGADVRVIASKQETDLLIDELKNA